MIEEVITYLNTHLDDTDLFGKLYGLVEQIDKDGKMMPGQYQNRGDYSHIKIDEAKGVCYHRLRGTSSRKIADMEDNGLGCDEYVRETYPVRLFWAIPKNKLTQKNDGPYIETWIANNIKNALWHRKIKSVENTLKVDVITVDEFKVELSNKKVWNEEYKGFDYKVDDKYSLGYIDYMVTIEGQQSCFLDYDCQGNLVAQ